MTGSIRGEVHGDWSAILLLDAQRPTDGASCLHRYDDFAVSFYILLRHRADRHWFSLRLLLGFSSGSNTLFCCIQTSRSLDFYPDCRIQGPNWEPCQFLL